MYQQVKHKNEIKVILFGIKLGDTADFTTNIIVRNNFIASNRGINFYGYKDFSPNTTTMLLNNFSFGHGSAALLNSIGNISDTNKLNYMFTFTKTGGSANNLITETDQISLNTITFINTLNDLSLVTS